MARPEKYTEKFCLELGEKLLTWMRQTEGNIFIKRFLVEHTDVSYQRISELVKKYDSFSDLIKKAKDLQEMRLVDIALNTGKPIGAIFLLKNHHGYADKQEIKTENLNRNLDTQQLASATDEQLKDLLRNLTDSSDKGY